MKRRWRYALFGFFVGMILLGCVTLQSIHSVRSHGQLINYVGIVRGATQRLVKLELADTPSDELIVYLDDILENLTTGKGKYGLALIEDRDYRLCLEELDQQWGDLKELLYIHRTDTAVAPAFLDKSEQYFDLANQTVFAAEAYSSRQTRDLTVLIILLFVGILAVWAVFFRFNFKEMLHLKSANQDLSDQAGRDPLTGAYDLSRFQREAQLLLDGAAEEKYALFYVDFADFKYLNDLLGYACGDNILKRYAALLSADMGDSEVFGRINADNFVILRQYDAKRHLLQRQRYVDAQIVDYVYTTYQKQSLPVRCGICCVEDTVEQLKVEGLMDRANFARGDVKTGTVSGQYCFYDEGIRRRLFAQKAIESSMADALKAHEFEVYYQPKVDPKSGQIACAEALVRWRRADGTVIPPDQFIPVFEKNRTIPLLDRYVFEEVCIWLRHMLDSKKRVLPVSVNVSRMQFGGADFVPAYTAIRDKYHLPPQLLEIEFTETILFENWDQLSEIVDDLQAAGFSCAIDDFGKGYSSLSTIKNLSIDVLKIDALFFRDMVHADKDRLIVEGIINLVRQFGIVTVAEGIEDSQQVEFLRRAGCDLIQGYVFYRPMPQPEYEALLASVPLAAN